MELRYVDAFLSVLQARETDRWQWEYFKEGSYWWVRYTGFNPPCQFYVEVGPTLLSFHAPLEMQMWAECRLAVYRYALRLNEELTGAKLGLSHDGRLALMVEWPHDGLTFGGFEAAVHTLLTSFATYHEDIRLVAQDVDLARCLAAREREQESAEKEITVELL